MRTKRERRYDRFYYDFELWLVNVFWVIRAHRFVRDVRTDREFKRIYREEIRPFWKQFGWDLSPLWFKYWYKISGDIDKRYIPVTIHRRYIVPYFDEPSYERVLEDKNMYHLLFPQVRRPETVFKHIAATDFNAADPCFCEDDLLPIGREEAVTRLLDGGKFIIKPARDTGGGAGIRVFSSEEGAAAIDDILSRYEDTDYIVQRILRQHPDLAGFNESSVNTIRIETLVFRGEVHFLSAILRIGHQGMPVDNVSAGGYQVEIGPDGVLKRYGWTKSSDRGIDTHAVCSDSGKVFEGSRIPSWEKIRSTVTEAALRLPHLKIVGWDLSVTEDGEPVLIEFNCHFGANQENCGPTFGDMTEEVLREVFQKRIGKRAGRSQL